MVDSSQRVEDAGLKSDLNAILRQFEPEQPPAAWEDAVPLRNQMLGFLESVSQVFSRSDDGDAKAAALEELFAEEDLKDAQACHHITASLPVPESAASTTPTESLGVTALEALDSAELVGKSFKDELEAFVQDTSVAPQDIRVGISDILGRHQRAKEGMYQRIERTLEDRGAEETLEAGVRATIQQSKSGRDSLHEDLSRLLSRPKIENLHAEGSAILAAHDSSAQVNLHKALSSQLTIHREQQYTQQGAVVTRKELFTELTELLDANEEGDFSLHAAIAKTLADPSSSRELLFNKLQKVLQDHGTRNRELCQQVEQLLEKHDQLSSDHEPKQSDDGSVDSRPGSEKEPAREQLENDLRHVLSDWSDLKQSLYTEVTNVMRQPGLTPKTLAGEVTTLVHFRSEQDKQLREAIQSSVHASTARAMVDAQADLVKDAFEQRRSLRNTLLDELKSSIHEGAKSVDATHLERFEAASSEALQAVGLTRQEADTTATTSPKQQPIRASTSSLADELSSTLSKHSDDRLQAELQRLLAANQRGTSLSAQVLEALSVPEQSEADVRANLEEAVTQDLLQEARFERRVLGVLSRGRARSVDVGSRARARPRLNSQVMDLLKHRQAEGSIYNRLLDVLQDDTKSAQEVRAEIAALLLKDWGGWSSLSSEVDALVQRREERVGRESESEMMASLAESVAEAIDEHRESDLAESLAEIAARRSRRSASTLRAELTDVLSEEGETSSREVMDARVREVVALHHANEEEAAREVRQVLAETELAVGEATGSLEDSVVSAVIRAEERSLYTQSSMSLSAEHASANQPEEPVDRDEEEQQGSNSQDGQLSSVDVEGKSLRSALSNTVLDEQHSQVTPSQSSVAEAVEDQTERLEAFKGSHTPRLLSQYIADDAATALQLARRRRSSMYSTTSLGRATDPGTSKSSSRISRSVLRSFQEEQQGLAANIATVLRESTEGELRGNVYRALEGSVTGQSLQSEVEDILRQRETGEISEAERGRLMSSVSHVRAEEARLVASLEAETARLGLDLKAEVLAALEGQDSVDKNAVAAILKRFVEEEKAAKERVEAALEEFLDGRSPIAATGGPVSKRLIHEVVELLENEGEGSLKTMLVSVLEKHESNGSIAEDAAEILERFNQRIRSTSVGSEMSGRESSVSFQQTGLSIEAEVVGLLQRSQIMAVENDVLSLISAYSSRHSSLHSSISRALEAEGTSDEKLREEIEEIVHEDVVLEETLKSEITARLESAEAEDNADLAQLMDSLLSAVTAEADNQLRNEVVKVLEEEVGENESLASKVSAVLDTHEDASSIAESVSKAMSSIYDEKRLSDTPTATRSTTSEDRMKEGSSLSNGAEEIRQPTGDAAVIVGAEHVSVKSSSSSIGSYAAREPGSGDTAKQGLGADRLSVSGSASLKSSASSSIADAAPGKAMSEGTVSEESHASGSKGSEQPSNEASRDSSLASRSGSALSASQDHGVSLSSSQTKSSVVSGRQSESGSSHSGHGSGSQETSDQYVKVVSGGEGQPTLESSSDRSSQHSVVSGSVKGHESVEGGSGSAGEKAQSVDSQGGSLAVSSQGSVGSSFSSKASTLATSNVEVSSADGEPEKAEVIPSDPSVSSVASGSKASQQLSQSSVTLTGVPVGSTTSAVAYASDQSSAAHSHVSTSSSGSKAAHGIKEGPASAENRSVGSGRVQSEERTREVPLTGEELFELFKEKLFVIGLVPMFEEMRKQRAEAKQAEGESTSGRSDSVTVKATRPGNFLQEITKGASNTLKASQPTKRSEGGAPTKRIHWEVLENTEGTLWQDGGAPDGDDSDLDSSFSDVKSEFSTKSSGAEESKKEHQQ